MVQPMSTSEIYYLRNSKSIHAIFPDGNLGLLLRTLAGGRVGRQACLDDVSDFNYKDRCC